MAHNAHEIQFRKHGMSNATTHAEWLSHYSGLCRTLKSTAGIR